MFNISFQKHMFCKLTCPLKTFFQAAGVAFHLWEIRLAFNSPPLILSNVLARTRRTCLPLPTLWTIHTGGVDTGHGTFPGALFFFFSFFLNWNCSTLKCLEEQYHMAGALERNTAAKPLIRSGERNGRGVLTVYFTEASVVGTADDGNR